GSSACFALAVALAGSAAAVGLHMAGAGHFRIPLWYGLLFPLGYSAGALMVLDSVRRRLLGRVTRKDRTSPLTPVRCKIERAPPTKKISGSAAFHPPARSWR